jgi:hypothetical protein
MAETRYRGRRAVALENEHLEIIVTVEGGHIAAIKDKASGVNPLWSPPWPTIEPSTYELAKHPEYGADAESKLLCGILGHNLCLDLFGGPSAEEAAAGMTVHGEGSVGAYEIGVSGDTLIQRTVLEHAQLGFERSIRLAAGSRRAEITETVENLSKWDRPIAWTQHVTLGPPFVERGKTVFRASATKSKVIENDFTGGKGYMKSGAEFMWPMVPCLDGTQLDMQVFVDREVSGAFSTHLMDPSRQDAYFSAWSPESKLVLAYVWKQKDFPWLGIWEENHSRTIPPWNGKAVTRGMEFGASPFPENRRAMIDRGHLFGVPGYRWAPARSKVRVEYAALLMPAGSADEFTL